MRDINKRNWCKISEKSEQSSQIFCKSKTIERKVYFETQKSEKNFRSHCIQKVSLLNK